MRERLEALMLVLAVGSTVAIGAKRFDWPYNVALVLVGLVLVVTKILPVVPLDPAVVLVAFLPLLVFEGALFADADQLRAASRPILMLAVPGVAISLLTTAAVATWVLELPFRVALLLGALLAITDTVSVLVAFRSVRVPQRLAAIMEGESLFNDGTALVLVSVTGALLMHGAASPMIAVREFALATVGGVAMGALFGVLGGALLGRTPDHLTAILASLTLVLATALVADRVHASSVIAVAVAGLMIGRAARRSLGPSRVLALEGFWEAAGFGLNVLVFLLVGMQTDAGRLWHEAPSVVLALLAVHAGRAAAVYGGFGLLKLFRRETVSMRWQHVMVAGNIKGSLSVAAALALPPAMPYRDRLVTIVFGVTFATLMTQALPFRRLLGWIGVVETDPDSARLDRARAGLLAARRGQLELDDLLATGLISRRAHAELRAAFQLRVVDAEAALRTTEVDGRNDVHVEASLLNAQKAAVLEAGRKGVVGADAVRTMVDDIDEALLRLRGDSEERR